MHLPDASRGNHWRFCSSVPKAAIGQQPTALWTCSSTDTLAQAAATSSTASENEM